MALPGHGELLSFTGRVDIDKPVRVFYDKEEMQVSGPRIRVSSYNVEQFSDGVNDGDRTRYGAGRQAHLAAGIVEEFNPDILVLQEIENEKALCIFNLAFGRPYPLGYITRFDRESCRLNIAVLSRIPLKGVRELDFSGLKGDGRPPRGVLSFYVPLSARRVLLVYVVHLKSNWGDREKNESKRYNALKLITEDLRGLRVRYPQYTWETMIIGDMNVDPEGKNFRRDPSLEPLRSWIDLWSGIPLKDRLTLPTRFGDPQRQFPPVTFDRIFVTRELRELPWRTRRPRVLQKGVDTKDINAVGGKSKTHASDHYPVYVDVVK